MEFKFKINDEVKIPSNEQTRIENTSGRVGTIILIDEEDYGDGWDNMPYLVQFDDGFDGHNGETSDWTSGPCWWFSEENLLTLYPESTN